MEDKFVCECGTVMSRSGYSNHLRTKKHHELMKHPQEPTPTLCMKGMESSLITWEKSPITHQCDCGGYYRYNKARHIKSVKHRKYAAMKRVQKYNIFEDLIKN